MLRLMAPGVADGPLALGVGAAGAVGDRRNGFGGQRATFRHAATAVGFAGPCRERTYPAGSSASAPSATNHRCG